MSFLDNIQNKIVNKQELLSHLEQINMKGKKIVFTNGCFDIIHRGHIDYLSKARDLGDLLIVGVNSDSSVRRFKGNSRPIQDEKSRCLILSAMQFVDFVVLFDEGTPYELIKFIQPDVLVKGADYKIEDIVGYDIVKNKGGEVKTIKFIDGYSTSNIVNRIKQQNI